MITTQATAATANTLHEAASSLHEAVSEALEASPYITGRRLRVETGDGRVRLRGDVGTFFEKQMAQEVVRRIDGVELVENHLQVAWT